MDEGGVTAAPPAAEVSSSTYATMEDTSSSSAQLPQAAVPPLHATPITSDAPAPAAAAAPVTDADTGDRPNGKQQREQGDEKQAANSPSEGASQTAIPPPPPPVLETASNSDLDGVLTFPPITTTTNEPQTMAAGRTEEGQPVAQPTLLPALPPTLNADAINEAGEAEHAARVEENAKVEEAILTADAQASTASSSMKQEEELVIDPALAEQVPPSVAPPVVVDNAIISSTAEANTTVKETSAEDKMDDQPVTALPDDIAIDSQKTAVAAAPNAPASQTPSPSQQHIPPSPSSTSALSSVTVSAAPSIAPIPSSHSVKDEKEDDNQSQQTAVSAAETSTAGSRKPRSSTGRNNARSRANGSATTPTSASGSTSTSHNGTTRRSDKPVSTSSTGGGTSRTRAASSSQTQGQRQSSRSKTANSKSSANESKDTSNSNSGPTTRPARSSRQRAGASPPAAAADNDESGGTRRSRRTRQSAAERGRKVEEEEEEESEDADEEVTRCICGKDEDEAPAFMIQCETCKVWQHGPCVGFRNESDCPDTYYCEQCRPDLHPNLTSRGKKHARSVSATNKAALTGANQVNNIGLDNGQKDKEDERNGDEDKQDDTVKGQDATNDDSGLTNSRGPSSAVSTSRDPQRETSSSMPPTATSTGHPSYHRARSSADAAIVSSFLEQPAHSPSPHSPGSPGGSGSLLSSDGKRPMYPPTSHFAAPQNPKRRSTMNSRESAAFDESIFLANQNAIRESKLMAAADLGGSGGKRKRRTRDDDEMEIVKEEEEDLSDAADDLRTAPQSTASAHTAQKQPPSATEGESAQREGQLAPSATAESVTEAHEEEHDMEEDEESADAGADANTVSNPRKRRRRRGAGAPFTAPAKKRVTASRVKKGANEEQSTNDSVEDVNGSISAASEAPTAATATEEDAAGRKRKRENGADDVEQGHSRGPSPAVSHGTTATSQASTDKTMGPANKRRKASPAEETQEAAKAAEAAIPQPAPLIVANLELAMPQLALPTSTENSAAPSPAASTPNGQQDAAQQSKDQLHAEALTDGLLHAASALKGKKLLDDAGEDDSTPAPPSQVGDHDAANTAANGRGAIKQPNQYTYKRGGPGSRGGLKGSPSKRAALAAAAEARHGRYRDDTPSTYEDWINQPPSWGLPDHLSHLSHLLPHPSPLPLQVPKYTTSPHNSAAPSPITPQIENGIAAPSSTASTPTILTTSSLEPSAKIRFPSRRMSVPEMRKRAKMMLDYLSRVQVDMVDRGNRSRALATLQEGILQDKKHTIDDMPILPPPTSMLFSIDSPLTPQSTTLMDELSKQLVSFQEKFL